MGVSYSILLRYCNHEEFGLVDFDFLARACYVLNCDITDLIEYRNENKENKWTADESRFFTVIIIFNRFLFLFI